MIERIDKTLIFNNGISPLMGIIADYDFKTVE